MVSVFIFTSDIRQSVNLSLNKSKYYGIPASLAKNIRKFMSASEIGSFFIKSKKTHTSFTKVAASESFLYE